jgi:O-acetyl-ADP-ribose deacetylase (regulator of RNase III)
VTPRIRVRQGDLTTFEGDGIVNAANDRLVLETGVAGAIRQAGGPTIQEECRQHGPVRLGEAAITGAGKLSVRHVIHAVIIGSEPTTPAIVGRATTAALRLAAEHGIARLAMPVLGSGIGRMPLRNAATAMLDAIRACADADAIEVIVLFGYRPEDADLIETLL